MYSAEGSMYSAEGSMYSAEGSMYSAEGSSLSAGQGLTIARMITNFLFLLGIKSTKLILAPTKTTNYHIITIIIIQTGINCISSFH